MEKSIQIMVDRIAGILSGNKPSIYLYGSVALGDFKPGWSDIDILCLTEKPISENQAGLLVNLRQSLLEEYPDNPYFRLFEGGMLPLDAFLTKSNDTVVYWSTSGQRITDRYELDPFSTIVLQKHGKVLYGADHRGRLCHPPASAIIAAVEHHYDTIRRYAREVPGKVTSCGWLLDIARCLYTLETWDVIAKTGAGEWALRENRAPESDILSRAVEIRRNPDAFREDKQAIAWMSRLGPHIQRFADVLEHKLKLAREVTCDD